MKLKNVKNIRLRGQNVLSIKYDGQYIWRKQGEDTYTYLEYLEGDGYQYINTGIYPNNTTVIDIVVMNRGTSSASTTNNYYQVCGNYNSAYASTSTISIPLLVTSSVTFRYGSYYRSYTSPTVGNNVRGSIHVENGLFTVRGTNVASFTKVNAFTGQEPILFYRSGQSTAIRRLRVYSIQIQKDHELVFDGVPVMRNSDGELGFLNKVTNEFFTNAGTGTFIQPTQALAIAAYSEDWDMPNDYTYGNDFDQSVN